MAEDDVGGAETTSPAVAVVRGARGLRLTVDEPSGAFAGAYQWLVPLGGTFHRSADLQPMLECFQRETGAGN